MRASEFYEKVGRDIKDARKSRELTQSDIAKACGVSASLVCHYEKGTRKPTLYFVSNLALFFKKRP